MVAAGTPICAKHLAAVARTLQWADECADRGDLLDAIAWLGTLEAIGDEVPGVYAVRRDSWSAELARTRAKAAAARREAARGVKRCSRRGARRRRWIRRTSWCISGRSATSDRSCGRRDEPGAYGPGKTVAQSFLMLTTVQPSACASSSDFSEPAV